MNDEYESGGFLSGKGFYIALMLCVSVIALSAWMIVSGGEEDADLASVSMMPYEEFEVTIPTYAPAPTAVIREDLPHVTEVMEPAPTKTPPEEVTATVTEEAAKPVSSTKRSWVWPVVGEQGMGYSMDALTYNKTMGDWRTHDGIDIAAEQGAYVRAACGGTVSDVYEDVLYGTTVVIDHGAGLVSYYACLQAQPTVKVGDAVLAGDIIGAVGTTALCESAEAAHLHFAMSLEERSVDPKEYLPIL